MIRQVCNKCFFSYKNTFNLAPCLSAVSSNILCASSSCCCTVNNFNWVLNRWCVCVCFRLCVFAVTVFLWSEWMSDLSQEKEHPSRISLLQWFPRRCPCAESTDLSLWACLQRKTMLEFASASSAGEKHWHLDENAHCWPATHQDRPSPPPRAHLRSSDLTWFCKTQLKPPPPFSVFTSSPRRKKPNVCLLSPVFTSSLPPLSQPSPPVLAVLLAEPARCALHAAVQRQPQRLQPHQLPRLLPWSVLPAADRTDQRDGQPWGQRPLAVCCQGPGVLHSGPKGKDVVPLKTSAFKGVQKILFLVCFVFFSPDHRMRVLNYIRNCNKGSSPGLCFMWSRGFRRATDFDLMFRIYFITAAIRNLNQHPFPPTPEP